MKKISTSHGYTGKIAKIDLTTGATSTIDTDSYAPLFIGARGIAEKVFWDEGDFAADCFDPESVLVLMTSPLAGTLASAANQMCLFGRSTTLPEPQLRASMCGSGFGAELIALVQEHCFYHLEAPLGRVAGWDTPYPHAQEWAYFPGPARVGAAMKRAMEAA